MREDNYPKPVSDPEAEGLPHTADDDSSANDEVDSPRLADGPDPAPLPADVPLAVDRFGVTAEDARLGESVAYKLGRERPDVTADEPAPTASQGDDVAPLDEETDRPDPDAGLFDAPVPAAAGEPFSLYDVPFGASGEGGPVGRLVEPDEGAHEDDEPDAVAFDAGAAGGGATAEELAMHEIPEP
jgi:hypothetical protein